MATGRGRHATIDLERDVHRDDAHADRMLAAAMARSMSSMSGTSQTPPSSSCALSSLYRRDRLGR
jgi:hypothetical protein